MERVRNFGVAKIKIWTLSYLVHLLSNKASSNLQITRICINSQLSSKPGHIVLFTTVVLPVLSAENNIVHLLGTLGLRVAIVALWATCLGIIVSNRNWYFRNKAQIPEVSVVFLAVAVFLGMHLKADNFSNWSNWIGKQEANVHSSRQKFLIDIQAKNL